MSSQQQRQLLQKITQLVSILKTKLKEVGLTSEEVLRFFKVRVFCDRGQEEKGGDLKEALGRSIKQRLERAKQSGCSVRQVLVQLLGKLQIENGLIEEYQSFAPQTLPQVEQPRKISTSSLNDDPPLLTRESTVSIWQNMNDSVSSSSVSSRVPANLSQLISFQRQLNESLMKTKKLKQLIQMRLMQDMEDTYTNRIRHIHELLAMEGGC